jgi:hypothetical protein
VAQTMTQSAGFLDNVVRGRHGLASIPFSMTLTAWPDLIDFDPGIQTLASGMRHLWVILFRIWYKLASSPSRSCCLFSRCHGTLLTGRCDSPLGAN